MLKFDKVEFVFLILFMSENNVARDGLALDRCEDVKQTSVFCDFQNAPLTQGDVRLFICLLNEACLSVLFYSNYFV